jgi:hypothetical protein
MSSLNPSKHSYCVRCFHINDTTIMSKPSAVYSALGLLAMHVSLPIYSNSSRHNSSTVDGCNVCFPSMVNRDVVLRGELGFWVA